MTTERIKGLTVGRLHLSEGIATGMISSQRTLVCGLDEGNYEQRVTIFPN